MKTYFSILLNIMILGILCSCNIEGNKSNRAFISLKKTVAEPTPDEETTPERPTGVTLSTSFCACHNGLPDIVSDCFSECSNRVSSAPTLYLSTLLSPEIELNLDFVNLQNWCTKPLGALQNPSCLLRYEGENNDTGDLPVVIGTTNTLTVDINPLTKGKTYLLKLIIPNSDYASENTIQLRRKTDLEMIPFTGPVSTSGVTRYSCLHRNGIDINNQYYFLQAATTTYFFTPPALPLPLSDVFTICHDRENYAQDGLGVPRFRQTALAFSVWNAHDIRFYDLTPGPNGNGALDINDMITNTANNLGANYIAPQDLFVTLELPSEPTPSGEDTVLHNLGHVLRPFISQTTGIATCPTQLDYVGSDPLYRALGDFIGVGTEALYLARKERLMIPEYDNQGVLTGQSVLSPADYMLISESQLKRIWFYSNNGTPQALTDVLARTHSILFHWPEISGSNILIKTSEQSTYEVIHPNSLSSNSLNGVPRNLANRPIPLDRRLACIPKQTL